MTTTSTPIRWDDSQRITFKYLKLLAQRLGKREPTQTELVRRAMAVYMQHVGRIIEENPEDLAHEFWQFEQARKPKDSSLDDDRLYCLVMEAPTIRPLATLQLEESKSRFRRILERGIPDEELGELAHGGRR